MWLPDINTKSVSEITGQESERNFIIQIDIPMFLDEVDF